MNDNELDELLNSWSAPMAPATLRDRVRAEFRACPRRQIRPRWFPAFRLPLRAVIAIGVFVLVLAKAAPLVLQAPAAAVNAPYIMETERTEYAEDGSPSAYVFGASYDADGREVPLSRTIPDNRLGTLGERARELLVILHQTLIGPIPGHHVEEHPANLSALRSAGCALEPVVARETILDYPTVAVRRTLNAHRRSTAWMAPALGCFALRYTVEDKQPDGTFRVATENRVLNVKRNPAVATK